MISIYKHIISVLEAYLICNEEYLEDDEIKQIKEDIEFLKNTLIVE